MRLTAGTTDQVIYFKAVSTSDYVTPTTGLVSTQFTVSYANNTTSLTAISSVNIDIAELSTASAPGWYSLKVNEGTTLTAGNNSQEMFIAIRSTGNMADVGRAVEVYRPTITEGQTLTVSSGQAEADIRQVNNIDVTGSGTTADPWGP